MGTVKGNWLTGAHSGRACNHEDIYTRVDKKTGKCYSVKLCNPNSNFTETQVKRRSEFGIISSAINTWIKTNRELDSKEYKSVFNLFKRQSKYATLRGYMMSKGMAKLQNDGSVIITINNASSTITSGNGIGNNTGGSTGDSAGDEEDGL